MSATNDPKQDKGYTVAASRALMVKLHGPIRPPAGYTTPHGRSRRPRGALGPGLCPREGCLMSMTWVVYRRPLKGDPFGSVGVCSQTDWAAMKADAWGAPVLVRAGFANEGEAERAARQESMTRATPAEPGPKTPDEA
jgi:hypothetical protein